MRTLGDSAVCSDGVPPAPAVCLPDPELTRNLHHCLGRKETGHSGKVWTLLLELVWEPCGGE